jgi:hypothetical protein
VLCRPICASARLASLRARKGLSEARIQAMYYDCACGLIFAIVPREMPLSEPEAAYCENCRLEIKGPDAPVTQSISQSIKRSRNGLIEDEPS